MNIRMTRKRNGLVTLVGMSLLSACAIGPDYHSNTYAIDDINPRKQCFAQLKSLNSHSLNVNVDEHGRNISVNSFQNVHNFHESAHCEMMRTSRSVNTVNFN